MPDAAPATPISHQQFRDQVGRYSGSGGGGGGSFTNSPGSQPGTQTAALLNRPVGRQSQGIRTGGGAGAAPPRDYGATWRTMGYGPNGHGPQNEGAGQHQVDAGGRAPHGADVPAEGVAGAAEGGATAAAAGGAEAAVVAAGITGITAL